MVVGEDANNGKIGGQMSQFESLLVPVAVVGVPANNKQRADSQELAGYSRMVVGVPANNGEIGGQMSQFESLSGIFDYKIRGFKRLVKCLLLYSAVPTTSYHAKCRPSGLYAPGNRVW